MADEPALQIDHVWKKYCKTLKRSMLYGLKDICRNTVGMSSRSDLLRKDEFWAVNDVSLEVEQGETLGIIGSNGSGKTTLLKMLNGIFWPDKGKITVRGRVGALIEIGAGFHPMLTGRENVYVNAAILGMSKAETEAKFDSIVKFADIGDFLDTPVKHYSSGMFVRLGFAVAVHCEPDILLVDEVLAVGDEGFQNKCFNKIGELRQQGITTILVSHDMQKISQIAERVILMDKGSAHHFTNVADGVRTYHDLFKSSGDTILVKLNSGNKNITFFNELIFAQVLYPGDPFCISLEYDSVLQYNDVTIDLVMLCSNCPGRYFQATNKAYGKEIVLPKGRNRLTVAIQDIPINNATAEVYIAIFTKRGTETLLLWKIPIEFKGITHSLGHNFFKAQFEIESTL
jgi:lipopolysaccharide transport system ATP-binding protein